MIADNDNIRLYLLSMQVPREGSTRYVFMLDGEEITLLKYDACELVRSIPSTQRNCKVSFDTVNFKAKWAHSGIQSAYAM